MVRNMQIRFSYSSWLQMDYVSQGMINQPSYPKDNVILGCLEGIQCPQQVK